jgi:hypothetical protein
VSGSFDHQILSDHAYAVVDPAALEDLPAGIRGVALVPASLAASEHLMPRLIELRGMPDALDGALLEALYQAQVAGEPPPVALMVQSDLGAEEFARYWNTLQLATPQPGRQAWLRVHDPRVLHQMLRILNAAQRRKLFGRSEYFTYWAGDQWLTAYADDEAAPGAAAWDWTRVERIGSINRALSGAGLRHAAALTTQGALAEQLIERAGARHGLTRQDDIVEFATRGLTTRATFDDHPAIAARIQPDDDSSLADRLALVDDSVWNALRPPFNTQ